MSDKKQQAVPHTNLQLRDCRGAVSVYEIPSATGTMTCYDVFPGVQLCFNCFSTTARLPNQDKKQNIMEINYCRQGRYEGEFEDGTCTFMGEGDFCMNMFHHAPRCSRFPLGYYEGIGIFLDMDRAAVSLKNAMEGLEIDLWSLYRKLGLRNKNFYLPSNPSVSHIFSELCQADSENQMSYYRLKILELMLFLGSDRVAATRKKQKYYPKATVEAVKDIRTRVTRNCQEHIPLEQLADEYSISLSALKNCFRDIYGQPPYAYLKQYRIQRAADLLREEDASVGWIADRVGYTSPGKFTVAFKSVMGCSPSEYRKNL